MNIKTPVKILICLLLIGVIGFSSMTYSTFSDTETSEGNTITVSTDYLSYVTATLMMENIDEFVPPPTVPQVFNLTDDIGGNFTYNTAGPEFVYDFEATVLCPSKEYVLATFQLKEHGNPNCDKFWLNSGVELDRGFPNDDGILMLNGSVDLGGDLTDTLVFLVLPGNNDCSSGHLGGNWAQDYLYHLYSMELIQYDDTDVPD